MVDNIKGSEYLINNPQINNSNTLQALLAKNKAKQSDGYSGFNVKDQTEISKEAYQLLEKEEEVKAYTQYLLEQIKGEDSENSKVAAIAEQYKNGTYQMPTDDQLAEALLGNGDFKDLMGL